MQFVVKVTGFSPGEKQAMTHKQQFVASTSRINLGIPTLRRIQGSSIG
ncbi:hypothetical protein ACNI65_11040 [Roseateles sp. So40a]